jgi:hypothetical protein
VPARLDFATDVLYIAHARLVDGLISSHHLKPKLSAAHGGLHMKFTASSPGPGQVD